MNKVYFAQGDEDYGGIYIAAPNGKEAKKIALGTWVMDTVYNYIDLRISRCWSVKETEYEGKLNIKQINELGLSWWCCPACDNDEFEILDANTYKCKKCGGVYEILYM